MLSARTRCVAQCAGRANQCQSLSYECGKLNQQHIILYHIHHNFVVNYGLSISCLYTPAE